MTTLPPAPSVPEDSVRDEVRAWAAARDLDQIANDLDRSPRFPHELFHDLGRARLLGLHVPGRWGGRGLPLVRAGGALFEMAYRGGTLCAKLSLQPEFSSVLAERGSDELRREYYLPMVRGEALVGNQITEPGAGSDLASLATVAERIGEDYRIRGVKSEAAFATDAHAAIVYARTGPARAGASGVTAFLVPQDLPGIERRTIPDLGERWMRRGKVVYDGVRVPARFRLGEEGMGLSYVRPELTRERALLAPVYLGVARASWESAFRQAGDRSAFGRPLWQHEAIGFPLVEDWARLDAAWEYAARALGRLDRGEPAEAEAALAKWLAVETALAAINRAIQTHGGRGYSDELPHGRRWRDVRSGALGHGTSEIMHRVAAGVLWRDGPTSRSFSDPGPTSSP